MVLNDDSSVVGSADTVATPVQETAAPAVTTETTTEVTTETPEKATPATTDSSTIGETEHVAEAGQQEPSNKVWEISRKRAEAEANRRIEAQNAAIAARFSGRINPLTNQPIRSVDDLLAYQDAQEQLRAQRTSSAIKQQMQAKGLDPNLLEAAIAGSPMMLQAQQAMNALKAAQEQQAIQEGERLFDEQLKRINKLDSTITSLDDLQKLEGFEDFDRRVRSGYALDDAFVLTWRDRLESRKAEAAKQAAINATRSKEHLTTTGAAAGSAMEKEIPSGELATWKNSFPDETPAQLRARYNKALNALN